MFQAYHNIVNKGGFGALWSGTPSRTVEGALLGAFFILGSTAAKKQVLAMGGGNNLAALAGGTVGGDAGRCYDTSRNDLHEPQRQPRQERI
jgi:hypothetical protein